MNWKMMKLQKENEHLKKMLDKASEEVTSLRDIVFAIVKQQGRVRIEKAIADLLRSDDAVEMLRQDNGDWLLTLKQGEAEVKPAAEVKLISKPRDGN